MAWTVESKDLAAFETDSDAYTTPSLSFAGDSMVFIAVAGASQDPDFEHAIPTASGLTFTEFDTTDAETTVSGIVAYWALVPGGGFTGTITFTHPSSPTDYNSFAYEVLEITGHDTTQPARQTNFVQGSATSASLDFGTPSEADALSIAFTWVHGDEDPVSADSGWTAFNDTAVVPSGPKRAFRGFYQEGTDASIVFSWTNAAASRSFMVELAAATTTDRNVDVSWGEMEVGDPGATDRRADVSFGEMEVPTPAVPAEFGWEQSDMDGGGGINCFSASDDGTFLLAYGDISGPKRSLDGGQSWRNCARGIPDGGTPAVGGGVVIRPGSNTEALAATKFGLFHTDDQGDNWTLVSEAVSFGDGGGPRPRENVGRVIDSVGDFAFMIENDRSVHRYQWSTGTLTTNVVAAGQSAGLGSGIAVDKAAAGNVVFSCRGTGGGLWKVTGATTGSGKTATKFNGSGAPTSNVYDVDTITVGGQSYAVVAHYNQGIKRVNIGDTGNAWTNISPSGFSTREWQSVALVLDGSTVRLGVTCVNGPELESGKHAQYWTATSPQGSPTWTPHIEMPNEKGGPGGEPLWTLDSTYRAPSVTNSPVLDSNHSGEACDWFFRDDRWWFGVGGQQGVWIVDVENDLLYPGSHQLGVASNGAVLADPNVPGSFLAVNTDHIVWGTQDGGDTWFPLEKWIPDTGGTNEGFDVCAEKGTQSFRWFIAFGERSANQNGRVYAHSEPFAQTDWTDLGIAGSQVPMGIDAFRAPNPSEGGSPNRTFLYIGRAEVGIQRQILNGLTKVGSVETISGAICDSMPSEQRFGVRYINDDVVAVIDGNKGIGLVNNARAASPTAWVAWSFSSPATVGENWIERIDDDSMLVSIGSGSDSGVYVVEGLSSLSNNDMIDAELPLTAVADPGGGSWNRPGPMAVGAGKAFISDLHDQTSYPAGETEWFMSETAGFKTGYSEITDDASYGLFEKVDGAAVDQEGQLMVVMSGPGAATYRLGEGVPGVEDRIADVGWAEMEAPLAPRGAEVSWSELEIPPGARTLDVSFAEIEIPEFARVAQVSWAEVQVADTDRQADVSFGYVELPAAPRLVEISFAEMEVPEPFVIRPEAAEYIGLTGRILVPVRWRLRSPWRRR